MYIFLFHLEKDDDQKPTLKKETKSTAHESNPAEKVDSEDFEMESVEVIGDEIESGKFPFIFDRFFLYRILTFVL